MTDLDIQERAMSDVVELGRAERATVGVLVKFTPEEVADLDRVRGGEPRTVFVKRFMRAVVRRIDDERGSDAGRCEAVD